MGIRKIVKMHEDRNVCVTGLRGRGKDMLQANVTARRKIPYICNVDYGGHWIPFDANLIDCGKNTYKEFITGDVWYYEYPFPDGTDVYLSDAGIYYPSQYCSELNKQFPHMATFQAISRHVGDCNFHFNVQNLNRCWDKIREQSDTYIMCLWCFVIFGFVFQKVRIYDKYDSCVSRVKPFNVSIPLFAKRELRFNIKMQKAKFDAMYGDIKNMFLVYRNKSNYDTRRFKEMLKNGKKHSC